MAADQDMVEYLEDEAVGTVGTDLFASELPAGKTEGMVVTQYPGAPPELTCGSTGITVDMPRFQFRARYATETTAITKVEAAATALAKVQNQTIEGTRYRSVTVLQTPGLLFRDDNNKPNWGFNFEAERDV